MKVSSKRLLLWKNNSSLFWRTNCHGLLILRPFSPGKISPFSKTLLTFRIRAQTENVLFGDIEFALNKTVEERLWTHVHYRVIDDYRKRLVNVSFLFLVFGPNIQHEKQYGVSRPVENRKLIDHYTRFLKDCTNYYRMVIQKLVSNFNIVELHPIVSQFKLDGNI